MARDGSSGGHTAEWLKYGHRGIRRKQAGSAFRDWIKSREGVSSLELAVGQSSGWAGDNVRNTSAGEAHTEPGMVQLMAYGQRMPPGITAAAYTCTMQ